jgi:hypothetical protein
VAQIGDVLERADKREDGRDRIRLTAVNGTGFVAEALDAFGPPLVVSASELAADYGTTDVNLPDDESTILRRADIEATQRGAAAYFGRGRRPDEPATEPHPDSPEGQFRALAEAETDDGAT